jgi:group I intron endonuclease
MAIGTLNADISGIYRIDIGQRFYYGSAANIRRRISAHLKALQREKHNNRKMQNAYNKHRDFRFCVVEEVANLQAFPDALLQCEQYWIDSGFGDPLCMNLAPTAGNSIGIKHTDEARSNMSKAHIGVQCGMFHPRYGKTWSDEQREKFSVSKIGKKFSDSHKRNHLRAVRRKSNRDKISKAHTGRKHSPEWIENRMKNMRGADNVRAKRLWIMPPNEPRLEFGCTKDAANYIGISRVLLTRWIIGERPWPGEGKLQRKSTAHLIGLKGGYI